MPLTTGQIFAGYTIVRLLGSGGMGEVYLAQHPRLPRRDALKLLPREWSADEEFRARFNREADLASTLWHPHIVGVHDRGDEDGQLWISMDFVDGLDAAQLLTERYPRGMPLEQAIHIVTALASALDYAHKQKLLHRDVKPANIMLTHVDDEGDQRILLTDFGIARNVNEVSGLTKTNFTVGTVAYSAPEQLLGEDIDGRADQYSLAATAFHLLTGSHLFPHSNPAVVISRHLNNKPPALAGKRPELAKLDPILAKGLAKRPNDRYRRCTDFAQALSEQIDSAGTRAQAAPTMPAPVHPQPGPGDTKSLKPRLIAVAAAVVAVTLTAGLMVMWRPWHRPSPPSPGESHGPATSLAQVPPNVTATTAVTTTVLALPAYLPPDSGCPGHGTAHHDIDHKTLGPIRIFLTVSPAGPDSGLCIASVTAGGRVLPAITLNVSSSAGTFGFANPATDATGNTFITYNAGGAHGYDGVLVLIPTANGFEDIGWSSPDYHYMGQHAYLDAELLGLGADGRYAIRQRHNDCAPSCAEGMITTKDLHCKGSDYVP